MTLAVEDASATYSHDRTLNDLESDVVRSRATGISSCRSGESHLFFRSTKRYGPEALRGVLHTKSLLAETCPVTIVDGLAGRRYEVFCTSEQAMSQRHNGNASVSPLNRILCEKEIYQPSIHLLDFCKRRRRSRCGARHRGRRVVTDVGKLPRAPELLLEHNDNFYEVLLNLFFSIPSINNYIR